MAIPPPVFHSTEPEPLETSVVRIDGAGLAYEPVGAVVDEATGERVSRAWEMESDPPAYAESPELPARPGPRPYDGVTTRIRVYVQAPLPGRTYRIHIGASTHRVTFAEGVRVVHPEKGKYQSPQEYDPPRRGEAMPPGGARVSWWRRLLGRS